MRRALSHSPALLPAAAAVVAFVAALGIGVATKSGSSPHAATSLAAPVTIQAPHASVAAVAGAIPTPALKPRTPVKKPTPAPATPVTAVTPAASTVSAPPPSTGVIHTPTTGVIQSQGGGGVVHSTGGGGSGVVHGGN